MRGRIEALEADHRNRAWSAWWTAFLPHMKRAPSLADFLPGPKAEPKPKTADELYAIAQMLHARYRQP